MVDEYARLPYSRNVGVYEGFDWICLIAHRGGELEAHCVMILRELSERQKMLSQIFTKALQAKLEISQQLVQFR